MKFARSDMGEGFVRDYRTNIAIAFAAIGAFVFGGSNSPPISRR